ncbi:MAG: thioredoxin [Clostridiales bacterium]|nr:thioredoxin [Clostridiales bacterium]
MEYRFNENNFTEEVINSNIPVMIDFYAEWCGPCRMMSPIVGQFAKEYEGRVKIGKINVDEQSELAFRYGVQSIPSFIFIKDGKVIDRVTGAMPKALLNTYLENLAKSA